jgi:hypothetical protein
VGDIRRAEREIVCEFELQVLPDAVVPQVVTTSSGEIELGSVAPGEYTFRVQAQGVTLKLFPFTVTQTQGGLASGTGNEPVITSIQVQQGDVVVTVQLPAGVKKVTLESRTRVVQGAWVPRVVERTDGTAKTLVFRLPRSAPLEVLRVRGDAQETLPASFYQGTTSFNGQSTAGWGDQDPFVMAAFERNDTGTPPGEATRQVVESDIWSIKGDTLYFFNQYRGLQVIDLRQPDAPVVRGTLPLTAAGEQMYVLGDQHVVLLARDGCGWGPGMTSQAMIVEVTGEPKVVAAVAVEGEILESRMVGSALYVASQTYRRVQLPPKDGGTPLEQWEWGSVIASFDLANPTAPVARTTVWYAGYGNVITATDKFLFVASQNIDNWMQSLVRILDICAPDGAMKVLAAVQPAGRVADKFKMNLSGDVFTVISQAQRTRTVSVLETFSLAQAANPVKLAEIEVGHGESLFATRFDGDRVYIVTFLRIDPLWVVDLKDPAQPRISGELQVPGWSTYIHPLGDRLVSVGIDNSNSWKVAVSLFDVRDPARPGLLARVPLGENSSWSEANADEKAFTVLPDAGLILVPYGSWATSGTVARVQLIDLQADTLLARGVIDHKLQPRRATVHGDRIVSISGRELLVVNASDRDHPAVTAELELSWPVSRVLLKDTFLLEVTDAQNGDLPCLRVASIDDPQQMLSNTRLAEALPVLGATLAGDRLYVLQGEAGWAVWFLSPAEGGKETQPKSKILLTVYDLGHLPELPVSGKTLVELPMVGWGNFKALWPKPGLLVWSHSGGYSWWWRGWLDVGVPRGGFADAIWNPWGSGSGRLLAFDVKDAAAPTLVSDLTLSPTNNWWSFSAPCTDGGLVYLSHQGSEFIPGLASDQPRDPAINPPPGTWVTKYYLDVVDYADPATPAVRPPVNIPGVLQAVSHGGAVVYTVGYHWDANANTEWVEYLDACAYDGVAAALIASLKLPAAWPHPTAIRNGVVWLGSPGSDPVATLQGWALSETGQWVKLAERALAAVPQNLVLFDTLLAAGCGSSLELYDVGNPTAPTVLAKGALPGCMWPDWSNGAGSVSAGLWLPLNDYGVFGLRITAP